MKVKELITKLQELDPNWDITGTNSGSLYAWEDYDHNQDNAHVGKRYAHVFTDDRAIRYRTHRH
jgi:hypothetical protein